jgi:hypothetical protein
MEHQRGIEPGNGGADGVLGPLLGDGREARLARALAMGTPAFMRRARALECLVERLHAAIAAERERRLRILFPAGRKLEASDLRRRVRRFNQRWLAYLESVRIDEVRKAQSDYNRFYPVERELALPGIPPAPFREIPLLERSDLRALFPPLPEIEA